jgi:DNA polymerase alpha subunit A
MQPVATAEDAAFLADLLGEVDTNIPSRPVTSKAVKTESRRKVRVLSPPIMSNKKARIPKNRTDAQSINSPPLELTYEEDDGFLPPNDEDIPMSDPAPSSPIVRAVERKGQAAVKVEEDEDETMEIAEAVADYNVKIASVNISGSRPAPKIVKKDIYPTPESSSPARHTMDVVDPSSWNAITSKLNVLSSPASQTSTPGKICLEDAIEQDGSLRMFWTDYIEINGSLCLFGKVKNKSTGLYVSAFLKVDNILRKLFFLLRAYRQSKLYCAASALN